MNTHHDEPWWRTTWPLGRSQWAELGVALAVLVGLGVLIGMALTDWSAPNAVTRLDHDVATGLVERRTPTVDDVAHWGALLADTPVKIGATALVVGWMLWRWRRWHEALFVALTLVLEATAFIITTWIVQRPRPQVERLLESPVDSSFPSGHVAAATVYASVVVVIFWHTQRPLTRAVAVGVALIVPVIVGWARMYQGMHYLSDVIAGVVLGISSLLLCHRILGRPEAVAAETLRGSGALRMQGDLVVTSDA